ncbi:MAG: 5'-nucleotidase, lipoprotein e(P4) family [Sebaldella sp.]|nr:5'-nucleotidase, lipoprotein e(P4) family [Sebaldella sp.]
MKKSLVIISFTLLLLLVSCSTTSSTVSKTKAVNSTKSEETVQMSYEKLQSQQTVLGTVWMQESGEYRALAYQVYNAAKDRFLIEKLNLDNKNKKLAVIMDIDETVLNNIYTQGEYIKEGKNYSKKAWDEWVKAEKATAIPGAVGFVSYVYKNGGEVFFITNRNEDERLSTLNNLEKEGFIVDNTHLILKTKESSKEARRKVIEDSGYKVIIYVGDDLNDFIDLGSTSQEKRDKVDELKAEFGKKYFILPNPVYGGFESGLDKNYYKTDYKGRVEIRENQLEGWK